ncbi:hypothetical protein DKP76_16415 [Falsochrobactrum shanghaiense]|uniref:BON domain-containing protein n=1 Tax=Falsochrobactrum shanghaiense TaxID=2201899 RepID=A0A316J5G8_9HYPH|nr:hypothetical protein DKP76_16415 [Falsochrobactrum shanghaiense]
MPGRYQREDRGDYYNEPYRNRGFEGSRGGYGGSDDYERYADEYQSRRRYDDDEDERYSYNSPRRDSFFKDERSSEGARSGTQRYSVSGGQHRGKGPKGYTRSDERIKEDVCDALMDDADLDASDIEVSVKKGEVTLQGQVEKRSDKRRAEECAEACLGVSDVQNNIKIRSA